MSTRSTATGIRPVDEVAKPVGDYYRWSLEQADLIRNKKFDEIDWQNIAEEIESVGNSELRSLRSNVEIVLLHMLKWDFQAAKRSRSWVLSIKEHRVRVAKELQDSPSMASRWGDVVTAGYETVRYRAARETDLPLKTFPLKCPYDRHEILDADYSLEDR